MLVLCLQLAARLLEHGVLSPERFSFLDVCLLPLAHSVELSAQLGCLLCERGVACERCASCVSESMGKESKLMYVLMVVELLSRRCSISFFIESNSRLRLL